MTPAEILRTRTRIAEIDTLLASGAASTSVDGTTVSRDFTALRTERDELRRKLPPDSSRNKTAFNIKLG